MCRSRRSALAFHPRPLSSSSSSSSTTTTFFTTTPSQSQTLPSLLYSPSDISSALAHSHTKPLSSSSFRCSLLGRDVFLHRCRFRSLPHTLPSLLPLLCRSHHRSLARLLGASLSSDHIYLAYDFAPGSPLSSCLRNPRNPSFSPLPSWISRMHVAADLAQALDYIHQHTGAVHNRLTSSSVIVSDSGFGAKICFFGASLLAGDLERIEGTAGYLAPEVVAGGHATGKSDVFAFGVVLLELMSGDEPLKCRVSGGGGGEKRCEWVSLIETAREAVGGSRERVRLWVDGRLRDSFPLAVAERMLAVALRCVERDAEKRPEMGWVQGKVSQLFLESKVWSETMRVPVEISASFAPR